MRIKDNFPRRLKFSKSPKRIVKTFENSCDESKGTKTTEKALKTSNAKMSAVSYSSLSESVIQDASIRMMLALEDERGESNKGILDVRMKNLKKLFGSNDTETKMNSSRSSISTKSSIISIRNPRKEKMSKNNKVTEGIAALLIKTIHSVPLENLNETQETPTTLSPANNVKEDFDHSEYQNVIDNHESEKRGKQFNCKDDIHVETSKAEIKKQYDSSFEENTPSSNGLSDESSIDSANYNILRDSKFSINDTLQEKSKFTKTLVRADTFPPFKIKSSEIKLQRTDSEMRPLRTKSMSSLIKYLSMNQIPFNLRYTVESQIDPIQNSYSAIVKVGKKEESIEAMTKNATSTTTILTTKISKNIENDLQSQQSINNSQDFDQPLATSTPVENRHPFFSEVQEHDSSLIITENKLNANISDYENCEMSKKHNESSVIKNDMNNINDDLSSADESEVSVSTYFLLQNASDTERKNKNIPLKQVHEEGFSSLLEETDSIPVQISFKNKERIEKLEEHNVLKFSASTHSLPSLQPYQFHTYVESNVREDVDHKVTAESMSKTSSSIESLIQSSCNDLHDTTHKNRQRRMLDLIRLIDTKMMAQPQGYNNSGNYRLKRKKRDKLYRNVNPRNMRKNLHNRFLKRHLQTFKHAEVILPLNESVPVLLTPDTSSYNSSLESIITSDTLIKSRLRRTAESFRSKKSFPIKRSAVDSIPHETTAKELTIDSQSSDSVRDNGSIIEMKELKPRVTNPSISSTSIDPAVHKSHSICNIREVSNDNELTNITNIASITYNSCVSHPSPNHRQQDEASLSPSYPLPAVPSVVSKVCQLPTTKAQPTVSLHRRSSDSDLSITPKGNSLGTNDRSMTGFLKTSTAVIRTMNQDAFEMLEYPFITMQQYPAGFILHIGGLVSSRSVKLLERISNLEEPESRDAWWKEVRMEVRSHARALACNVVIGYKEETSICDDVCVLNAYGTAAIINLYNSNQDSDSVFINKGQSGSVVNTTEMEREKAQQKPVPVKAEKSESDTPAPASTHQTGKVRHVSENKDHEVQFIQSKCSLCHLPYNEVSVPFRVNASKCAICKRARVPDVMFTTIELPENVLTIGRGGIIQATACKTKKDLRGELNAKEISDCLPFLEYELHSLLLNKLKVKGMNAIFGLKLQVSVGERLIIGMAVGTAVFLTALPAPSIPQIASGNAWPKEEQLAEIQKTLLETVKKNREFYRLKPVGDVENGRVTTSDTDESDEDLADLDFNVGTRDACVLEVDDIEDMDRISLLMDDRPPDDFHVVNTQTIPGLDDLEIVRNLQMFTQISRTKIPAGQFASMPSKYFARLLQSVYFKLRRMIPCALCDMQFKLALPEPDEIQFTVIGMALGLGDPVKINKLKKKLMTHSMSKDQVKRSDDSDMIFNLDVDHAEISSDNASNITLNSSALMNTSGLKSRTRSPLRSKIHTAHKHKHVPLKGRYGVDITPLSYLPGGRIERYLGNLNFFFIRESTSIRENGGLSGFTHSFVMEVLAIVRAHITALGGNAMVAFFMTKCVLLHSPHKNQGQCLINVGGDVVSVSYFANDKHCGTSNC
ncbi:uncharacterized protein LOC143147284 isoform X2 [Ptiloglossa arizonensis]